MALTWLITYENYDDSCHYQLIIMILKQTDIDRYTYQHMKTIPNMFYGTAWKKERTSDLVALAIKSGFRAIDTACQPKHYNQPGVGQGIARSGIPREQLFLQTKYTPIGGQDPNKVPYNPKDDLRIQVRTSLQVSLKNLRTEYLDSLVLHSPLSSLQKTVQVWRAFEEFVKDGRVKALGISNCYSLDFFIKLYQTAEVKPSFLQNRFYSDSSYDKELRRFCKEKGVRYQSFWTLTANPHILSSALVKDLATKHGKTREQILYASLIGEGVIPLNGTTSEQHMKEDLSICEWQMPEEDRKQVLDLCK